MGSSVWGKPSTYMMGSKLAAKILCCNSKCCCCCCICDVPEYFFFQRTRELTLFPGLIPAQAIKFLPSQQPLQFRLAQSYLLLPALRCRRAFMPASEEVPESIPESAAQQQRVKSCSRARLCNYCVEST